MSMKTTGGMWKRGKIKPLQVENDGYNEKTKIEILWTRIENGQNRPNKKNSPTHNRIKDDHKVRGEN